MVMISLYVLGIVVAILSGLLLKNTIFQGNPVPFVMELPAYRLPSAKSVLLHMWEKAKDFVAQGVHHHLHRRHRHLVPPEL